MNFPLRPLPTKKKPQIFFCFVTNEAFLLSRHSVRSFTRRALTKQRGTCIRYVILCSNFVVLNTAINCNLRWSSRFLQKVNNILPDYTVTSWKTVIFTQAYILLKEVIRTLNVSVTLSHCDMVCTKCHNIIVTI